MDTKLRIARLPMLLGVGILAAMSMGNEAGGCVEPFPLDETACNVASQCEGLPHIDCAGDWQCDAGQCVFRCGSVGDACAAAADCEGLPHDACVGAWDCLDGQCAWECANETPVGCHGDQDCPSGSHCSVSDGDCQTDPNCPMCDVCYGHCVPDEAPQCLATGCSGEICATEPMDSACIWLDWFACLDMTTCGPLADGTCGFAATEAFDACVQGIQCDADADCPAGYECPVYRCGEDDPSLPAERCTDAASFCTPKHPSPECTEDADCPPGQFCALTPQCPPCDDGSFDCMGPCQLAGVCMPIEQPMQCQGDQDCPVGFHCEYQGGCPPCECGPDDPNCACPMCMPPQFGECVPDSHCCEDKDGDYFCVQVDCDDLDPTVNLLAPEVCDGRDNDCDGVVDEGCQQPDRCTEDSQCGPGQYCQIEYCPDCEGCPCYGICRPIVSPECLTDADCPDGFYCAVTPYYREDGQMACCPPNALCGPSIPPCGGGVCLPVENPMACVSDEDCPKGYLCAWTGACPPCDCDPATGECICPDCIPVEHGYCVPAGCEDRDGDGVCAGEDCDYQDPLICPWMPDVCGDGIDNDCDGLIDETWGAVRESQTDQECYEGETCRFDGT
jgi:eight-cysteine-cluster-containing protein